MKRASRLGIIDWGIGGIGLYKLAKSRMGNVPVVYLSDTGATPYGKMSRRELISRLNDLIAFLGWQGVTHLLIGCNAASTVIPFLNIDGMRVEGVIQSAVNATAMMLPARLALIGGRRTVLSGVYRRAFAERGIKVEQRIAQPLSALIESGDVSSNELRSACRQILSPVKNCSHLLLACTHYPAIASVLEEFVSTRTVIVDPAVAVANKIKHWKLPTAGTDVFLTSGDPEKLKGAAWQAFGVEIKKAERVAIANDSTRA